MTRDEEKELAKELSVSDCTLLIMDTNINAHRPVYEIMGGGFWLMAADELIILGYPPETWMDEDSGRYAKLRSQPDFNWDGSYVDNRSFDEVLRDVENLISSDHSIIERVENWVK